MTTADSIVGKWYRFGRTGSILIQEQYRFYGNGLGQLWIIDNRGGFEECTFCYEIDLEQLYLIEKVKDNVSSYPIAIANNTLTINTNGTIKQYQRAK